MNKKRKQNSNGQILVIVTLMLVGLFAMLALVLDGGNVYTQRRQAQLAADAGALAGARAHCDPDVSEAPAVAANNYVTINDATLKNFSMGPGEHEVTVEAMITFDTFFLHILGRPELTAEAIAAAKCEPGGGASVLPVAWSCRPPDLGDEPPDEGCQLNLDPDDKDCTYPSEEGPDNPADLFYIIIDSDDLDESIICAERYHEIEDLEGFDCGDCDSLDPLIDDDYDLKYDYCHSDYPKCDLDCDGDVDLEILKESSFGWMDLDGGGSNANELRQWIIDPSSGDLVFTHHWYASKSGVAGSVYDAVGDNLVGKNAIVPVFDSFCHGLPEWDNDECMWHPRDEDLGPDDVVESGGTWDDYFHIIGFANYKVMCVESGPHPLTGVCEIHDELVALGAIKKNAKSIEGCFIKGVSSNIVDAGGGDDFDAYTLVLSR